MDYDQVLDVAIRAARAGGELAHQKLGEPSPVRSKGTRDVVTPNIRAVEERILETIRSEFPDHAILSEESAPARGRDRPAADSDPLWIVDPIDGSLNYIRGIPIFSVSVGFRHRGLYRVGVVYDPCRDELFHAVREKGSFLNGTRIQTHSIRGDGVEAFEAATVATDWPADVNQRVVTAMIVEIMAGNVVSLKILGSPALGLAYIAAGRLDAYFHLQLELWDVAAGVVILEDAGGVLTDAVGATWQHSDGGYLGTNKIVHGRMLDPIRLARER